ncbi:MAG: polyprenyl synthetase family protein [Alphaproteobacteria bacterium]|nr:polyprenyl synthetase family protein [Alphaproteobacteria bacterium]
MSEIKQILSNYSQKFNAELVTLFALPQGHEKRVMEAMAYSIMNGGKRLRAFLVYETAKLFGVPFEKSFRTSAALEMVHAYSLIHDDLPAMDDDTLRRGKPTCHIQFDEATAIIAGDGLLTYAFEILSDTQTHPEANVRCKLIQMIANAGGAYNGMVAGQMLDLHAEKCDRQEKNEALIKHIEEMKTGRLLKFACEAGAVLGNASSDEFKALGKYARAIGMAFQIADDILDMEGDPSLVGKTLKKDIDQGKITFVTLYGVEKAKKVAQELTDTAIQELSIFGEKANTLKLLAQFIIDRNH